MPDIPRPVASRQRPIWLMVAHGLVVLAASGGLDPKLSARRISLELTVQASGAAGYPTIADVATSAAPVGQCLKNAVKLIAFPPFHGEPVEAELPIDILAG